MPLSVVTTDAYVMRKAGALKSSTLMTTLPYLYSAELRGRTPSFPLARTALKLETMPSMMQRSSSDCDTRWEKREKMILIWVPGIGKETLSSRRVSVLGEDEFVDLYYFSVEVRFWLYLLCHYLRCVCSFTRLIQSEVDGRNRGVSYHAGTNVQKDDQQDSGRHGLAYDGWQDVRREEKIRVGFGVRRGEVGPIALGIKATSRLAKREKPHASLRSGCGIPKSHNSMVHIMEIV